MRYRRKPTRPPRQSELTELDSLRTEIRRLIIRNYGLLQVVREKDHTIDLLMDQKLRLAHELSGARGHIAFLQGQYEQETT